jgi:O-antigen biosynthesis protein
VKQKRESLLTKLRRRAEHAWQARAGESPEARAIAEGLFAAEQLVRPLVWRGTAPIRLIPGVEPLIKWLANSTKHYDPPPPPPEPPFRVPVAAETRAKMERGRLRVPTSDAPEVSIVVPVYNHFELTYGCLEAIAAHIDAPSYEVIVVDDGSTDETARMLATVDGVRVVADGVQRGFIGACNAGAAVARGRYLVFLNNDTEVQRGWLRELRDTFDAEPSAGIVGSKLLYPDGRLQECGGIVRRDGRAALIGRFADPENPKYNYLRRTDYCSGASIMIPRALFETLGGFDPHYTPAYYEDTDLALRVRQSGREVFYQPLSVLVHYEGMTGGTDVAHGVKRHQVINEEKFAARWTPHIAHHGDAKTPLDVEKDRGVRGHVLVIDAVMLQPDRDSGSLRMFNLVLLLRRLGFKVTFLPSNLDALGDYGAMLRRRGIEVLHAPYVTDPGEFLDDHADDYDLIILSRPDVAGPLLPRARRAAPRARIVYDTVDLHHVRQRREALLAADAELLRKSEERREEELALARLADETWVVSDVEKIALDEALGDARVRVVSNVHDVPGSAAPFAVRRDLMFIGGFGHPPNVDAVLYFVRDILPRIHARLPDLRLYVVGNAPPEAVRALAGYHVVVTGFVADLATYLAGCRLTVAPLRYGAGVKGKINMSMAHGVPVVATPLAVEGMHLVDGEQALVAGDAAAFADAVVRLHEDAALWDRLSQNGVAHTERHFSFAAAATALTAAIDALLPAASPAAAPTFTDGDSDANASAR